MLFNSYVRSSLGRARLEEDDFIINDVPLVIPPTQIQVEKQSFHYEWQTLRTRASQQIKSGHGRVTVSASCILKDLEALTRVVAGLRSTPFCVVYNKYIESQLGSIHNSDALTTYKQFQPIVLAMTSMSFSTMGQEGFVDCISAQFNFVYFNYFPYTPVFVFKTGPNQMAPGPAWQSELWEGFYRGYLNETKLPRYGRLDSSTSTTELKFNEYALVSCATNANNMATKQLVDTLKNKPKEFFQTALAVNVKQVFGNASSNAMYDTLYKELVKAGHIASGVNLEGRSEDYISSSTGPLLSKLLSKMIPQVVAQDITNINKVVGSFSTEINEVAAELDNRILGSAQQGTDGWEYIPGHDTNVKTSIDGQS